MRLKIKNNDTLFVIITEILLFSYMVTLIIPFVWILINSFKTPQEFFSNVWSLPENFGMKNYIDAWVNSRISAYFLNSIVITSIATFTSILFSSTTAYVLSKYKFKGRNIIYGMAVAGFLLPQVGTLAPFYILMKNMGLFNSLGLLIFYSGGIGAGMIILYSFFKGISWSYAEAAFLDGAGHFTVFFKIMLPMAKNGLIPLMILNIITFWNDYFIPSILINNEKFYTVSIGLQRMQTTLAYKGAWTVTFAAIIISIIPMIVIYIIFKNKIDEGFSLGGIKG